MGLAIPPVEACRTGGYNTVPSPFSMDDTTFRVLGYRLVDTLATYLDKLPHEPVYHPLPAEVRLELEKMNIPAEGLALEDIIESFLRHILPYGHGQNHPCFAAFANPAASKLSMLAAFASAVTNTSGAGGNYAAIYVERAVIRWLMELIGFPPHGSETSGRAFLAGTDICGASPCGRAPDTPPLTKGTCKPSWTPSGMPGSAASGPAHRGRPGPRTGTR